MNEWLAVPALAASAQHAAAIERKLARLIAAKRDTWDQMLVGASRAHLAGRLTIEDLQALLDDMRTAYGPGYTTVWNATMPVAANKVPHLVARRAKERREAAFKTWSGSFPLEGADDPQRVPPKRVPVVYVLFDATNEPVYVGSTADFRTRIRGHHIIDEHDVRHWMAWRCTDREHAYEEEERLLRTHKPRLNVRTTR